MLIKVLSVNKVLLKKGIYHANEPGYLVSPWAHGPVSKCQAHLYDVIPSPDFDP